MYSDIDKSGRSGAGTAVLARRRTDDRARAFRRILPLIRPIGRLAALRAHRTAEQAGRTLATDARRRPGAGLLKRASSIPHAIGFSRPAARSFTAVGVLACLAVLCAPAPTRARTAAASGSWSALRSELLDWPSPQLGLRIYIGPFGTNLYVAVGLAGAHDSGENVTSAGALLDAHYMLPAGDRLVPFIEGGLVGKAFRIDVLDRIADGPPVTDRTTYVRGGFRLGAGIDIALSGNWSVTAAVGRVWLGQVDTEFVNRGGRVASLGKNASYWELPRVAMVYWY